MRLTGLSLRFLLALALSLGLLPWASVRAGEAQTAREIASRSFPSVVLIATDDANGQPLALGSGFVVAEGIVTNVHVLRGASRATVKLVGMPKVETLRGILALDTLHDLVLLSAPLGVASTLTLGDSRAMAVGDEVYALGNPQGLEGTFSQGIISGIRGMGRDTLLQITAPISPGSSGGPVLNSKGEVIGVAVASFSEGQNLNFAIPTAFLAPLLRRATATIQPLTILPKRRAASSGRKRAESSATVAVEGVLFRWGFMELYGHQYSFSIRNRLLEPVTNVACLVIFYDFRGTPIDLDRDLCQHYDPQSGKFVAGTRDTIPPGLSRRYASHAPESVQALTATVEVRVLDFSIVH